MCCATGNGCDLVCLGEQPLHVVPLFQFKSSNSSSAAGSGCEADARDYFHIPHWINHRSVQVVATCTCGWSARNAFTVPVSTLLRTKSSTWRTTSSRRASKHLSSLRKTQEKLLRRSNVRHTRARITSTLVRSGVDALQGCPRCSRATTFRSSTTTSTTRRCSRRATRRRPEPCKRNAAASCHSE